MMWMGKEGDAHNILVVVASKCPRSRELLPHWYARHGGPCVLLASHRRTSGGSPCQVTDQLYLLCFYTMQNVGVAVTELVERGKEMLRLQLFGGQGGK